MNYALAILSSLTSYIAISSSFPLPSGKLRVTTSWIDNDTAHHHPIDQRRVLGRALDRPAREPGAANAPCDAGFDFRRIVLRVPRKSRSRPINSPLPNVDAPLIQPSRAFVGDAGRQFGYIDNGVSVLSEAFHDGPIHALVI